MNYGEMLDLIEAGGYGYPCDVTTLPTMPDGTIGLSDYLECLMRAHVAGVLRDATLPSELTKFDVAEAVCDVVARRIRTETAGAKATILLNRDW